MLKLTDYEKKMADWEGPHLFRIFPTGIIFTEMTSKIALGCVVMCIPAVTDLEENPFDLMKSGDLIDLDAYAGEIRIFPKN